VNLHVNITAIHLLDNLVGTTNNGRYSGVPLNRVPGSATIEKSSNSTTKFLLTESKVVSHLAGLLASRGVITLISFCGFESSTTSKSAK
jgi:hypothetical protein